MHKRVSFFMIFMAICLLLYLPSIQKPAKCNLSEENTRHLLISFLWIVKNVDRNVLKQWWSELSCELQVLFT